MTLKLYRQIALGLCFAFFASLMATPADAANRNSSWRWAKPLNEKPGSLLYTTNPAFKRSTSMRSSNVYTPSRSRQSGYRVYTPRHTPRLFRRFRR